MNLLLVMLCFIAISCLLCVLILSDTDRNIVISSKFKLRASSQVPAGPLFVFLDERWFHELHTVTGRNGKECARFATRAN